TEAENPPPDSLDVEFSLVVKKEFDVCTNDDNDNGDDGDDQIEPRPTGLVQ
ncbi:hypothetical protein KI387_032344, partial [Taxus chinensis]